MRLNFIPCDDHVQHEYRIIVMWINVKHVHDHCDWQCVYCSHEGVYAKHSWKWDNNLLLRSAQLAAADQARVECRNRYRFHCDQRVRCVLTDGCKNQHPVTFKHKVSREYIKYCTDAFSLATMLHRFDDQTFLRLVVAFGWQDRLLECQVHERQHQWWPARDSYHRGNTINSHVSVCVRHVRDIQESLIFI